MNKGFNMKYILCLLFAAIATTLWASEYEQFVQKCEEKYKSIFLAIEACDKKAFASEIKKKNVQLSSEIIIGLRIKDKKYELVEQKKY